VHEESVGIAIMHRKPRGDTHMQTADTSAPPIFPSALEWGHVFWHCGLQRLARM